MDSIPFEAQAINSKVQKVGSGVKALPNHSNNDVSNR
jgi:hypothetical protein